MGAGKTLNSLRGNLNKNRTTENCVLKKNQISKQSCREIRPTGGPPVLVKSYFLHA